MASQTKAGTLIRGLNIWLNSPTFHDEYLIELLPQSERDGNFDAAIVHLRQQLTIARSTILFPGQSNPETIQNLSQPYRPLSSAPLIVTAGWLNLVSDVCNVTLQLIGNLRHLATESVGQDLFVQREVQLVRALRILLEAILNTYRALVNERAVTETPYRDGPLDGIDSRNLVNAVRQVQRAYEKQSFVWLRELRTHPPLPLGWREASDAMTYNLLSQQALELFEEELGWLPLARRVSRELLFVQFLALLHLALVEARHAPTLQERLQRAAGAAFLGIHGNLNAWGLRPWRLVTRVVVVIGAFTTLYWLDDSLVLGPTFAHCATTTVTPSALLPALYYGVVNLTGLGILRGGPCGPFTGVVISAETVIGLVLLGFFVQTLITSVQLWIDETAHLLRRVR